MRSEWCLSQRSIAVKRRHEHSNSYKGNHLIRAFLQFQRFSFLSSGRRMWWHRGRLGAGKVAEICCQISRPQEERYQTWLEHSENYAILITLKIREMLWEHVLF